MGDEKNRSEGQSGPSPRTTSTEYGGRIGRDGVAIEGPDEPDVDGVLPRVLPASWQERTPSAHQRAWMVSTKGGPMSVLAGIERHGGRRWIHMSCARRDRLPSWDDLKLIKRVLAGPNRQAIQVLPREDEYVNIHPYCLHLFVCLDEDPVPSFLVGGAL